MRAQLEARRHRCGKKLLACVRSWRLSRRVLFTASKAGISMRLCDRPLHAEGYCRSSFCPLFTVAGCAGCKTREVFACPLSFRANDLTSRQMLFKLL